MKIKSFKWTSQSGPDFKQKNQNPDPTFGKNPIADIRIENMYRNAILTTPVSLILMIEIHLRTKKRLLFSRIANPDIWWIHNPDPQHWWKQFLKGWFSRIHVEMYRMSWSLFLWLVLSLILVQLKMFSIKLQPPSS